MRLLDQLQLTMPLENTYQSRALRSEHSEDDQNQLLLTKSFLPSAAIFSIHAFKAVCTSP